jgi:hypothetical protein
MCDIACGMQNAGLEVFARSVGASYMSEWPDLQLYDEDVEGWGQAFEQVVSRTLDGGGRIHFNLDGVDIAQAFAGDPAEFVGRYTAYELQQICLHAEWFDRTLFYSGGAVLTPAEVVALGIQKLASS